MQKNQTGHFSKSQNQNSKKFYRAKTGNNIVIYGKHPVFSAIQKKRRKIIQILVTKNTQNELDEFLKKNKIFEYKNLIKVVDPNQLDSILL